MCSVVEVTDLLLISRGQARGNGRRIVIGTSHLNMYHLFSCAASYTAYRISGSTSHMLMMSTKRNTDYRYRKHM